MNNSGYVSKRANSNTWQVYYWLHGKRVYVGSEKTKDAAIARWEELKAIEKRYLAMAWDEIDKNINKAKRVNSQ